MMKTCLYSMSDAVCMVNAFIIMRSIKKSQKEEDK